MAAPGDHAGNCQQKKYKNEFLYIQLQAKILGLFHGRYVVRKLLLQALRVHLTNCKCQESCNEK